MSKIGGWMDRSGHFPGEELCDMSRVLCWNGGGRREAYCDGGFGLLEHRMEDGEDRPYVFERSVLVMDGAVRGGNRAVAQAYAERGAQLADALEGSFSLALCDEARGDLILARSRDGGRPLYYRKEEGRMLFSSEIKGILALSPHAARVEKERLWTYLSAREDSFPPEYLYRDIREFPQGHTVVYHRLGSFTVAHSRSDEVVAKSKEQAEVSGGEVALCREALCRDLYEQMMLHDAPYYQAPPRKGKELKQTEEILEELLHSDADAVRYLFEGKERAMIGETRDRTQRVRLLGMMYQAILLSRRVWVM